jgi:hypothetical protein
MAPSYFNLKFFSKYSLKIPRYYTLLPFPIQISFTKRKKSLIRLAARCLQDCIPDGVSISKTFVFFTLCAPGELVTRSLQNVFRKLLVFNDTQLGQRNGPTPRYATHFVDIRQNVLPFCARGQHHLNNFLP